MKISYNWIKQFLKIDLHHDEVAEILTDLGLEVVASFTDFPLEIRQLLMAVAGCSPYLKSLMKKEQDWLCQRRDQ